MTQVRGLVLGARGSVDQLAERIQQLSSRLDAGRRAAPAAVPGQLGLDFSAPAPAPSKKPAAAGKGAGKGVECGASHISPDKTCRITGGSEAPAGGRDFSPKASAERAKGGIKFSRFQAGAHPTFKYSFRDRDAAEHWYADDNARAEADIEVGTDNRRGKAWQEDYARGYQQQRAILADMDDAALYEAVSSYASVGKSSRGGTATIVKIGGAAPAEPPAAPARVIPSPRRFGANHPASKPEEKMITAQEVLSGASQVKFAKQQRAAAYRAGDREGEKAWERQQREVERRRLAAAMTAKAQVQTGLFGVTEYDESMPLFGRTDASPIAQLLTQVLDPVLPGAAVLDWDQRRNGGITSGRAVAEGLVYQFRCDGEGVAFRPAWQGVTEEQWEDRSAGFLEVRNPGVRVDFKKVRFQQSQSKRKCSSGYSCGRACISLNKECRIQPKTAMGKQRLRQLQALAKEGDPLASQKAAGVETARLQKAYELREQREVAKVRKLVSRPEMQEYLRTGKLPQAPAAGGAAGAGGTRKSRVMDLSPDQIEVDPQRFQYKMNSSKSGEVGSLSGVKVWDDNLAGVISVWEDPADGKTYVVNGHNRLGLARRLGAEEVTVRYLKAANAKEARAIGAMQNIAEGAGTELDAAKFFRDTGLKTLDDVEAKGLPLKSGKAEKGLALSKLPKSMFDAVVQGKLSTGRGAIIGGSGLEPSKQLEVWKAIRARPAIADGTLDEYVQALAISEKQTQTKLDLLGVSEESVDTGLARADLARGLRNAFKRERRLFGMVANSKAATELSTKASNQINQEESGRVSSEADAALRFFDQMKNASGPLSNALNAAALRVTKGEAAATVAADLREAALEAMEQELAAAGLSRPKKPTNEAPTASMFDSEGGDSLEDRMAHLQDRLDARGKGQPCGRSHIPADANCRQGEGPEDDDEDGLIAEVEALLASSAEQDRRTEDLLNTTGSLSARIADKRLQVRQARRELDVAERHQRMLGRKISAMERGGGADDRRRRLDTLEARLARLDARVKQAPGQLGLFGGGSTGGQGVPCGQSHISPDKECRKGASGGASAAPDVAARVARQTAEIEEVRKLQAKQNAKPMDPDEIPITDKDLESMEMAREIMAGTRKPAEEIRARPAKSTPPAAKPFASPDELSFDLAQRAHSGTSFSPGDRARSHQQDFARHLNSVYEAMSTMASTPAQKEILEQEMAAYKEGYKTRYNAWLGAKSRVISPMITGPARFPVARNEKANRSEDKRREELIAFTKKAQSSIRKKLSDARDPAEVSAEEAAGVAKMVSRSLANMAAIDQGAEGFRGFDRRLFASNLAGRIGRMAARGEVEAVQAALDQIDIEQRSMKKPAFTPRHSIWDLAETARSERRKQEQAPTGQQQGPAYESGSLERDYDDDRVRIRFNDGKPPESIRTALKRSGWRWSPTNSAWQRKNTENSVWSAKSILQQFDRERQQG